MFFYRFFQADARSFSLIRQAFQNTEGLPFAEVLSDSDIRKAFAAAGCRFGEGEQDTFTPTVTLWGFLFQMLFSGAGRSCNAAVQRIRVLLRWLGKPACALNSGGYCKARPKIVEAVPQQLLRTTCDQAEEKAKSAWAWNGRKHVLLLDGTTLSGPDTPENQAEYPQPGSQTRGCGFPMMRVVVLISLLSAMVRSVAVGPYAGKGTGESSLFRQLVETIQPESVIVGDRYYCSYFAFAELRKKGIHVVTRLTNKRLEALGKRDTFRRLENGDLLVTWHKPKRPDWMSREEYDAIPDTQTVRLVEVRVAEKGFRVRHLHVVTTLQNPETDSAESLADLYRKRWHVELDIRSIKTAMELDILRGQTPHMMRLEFFVGLLAYNLIRLTILNSAAITDDPTVTPRNISFTAAQTMITINWTCTLFMPPAMAHDHITDLLRQLAKQRVGHRPGRMEPRVVKRRPKAYPPMQEPRNEFRKNSSNSQAIMIV